MRKKSNGKLSGQFRLVVNHSILPQNDLRSLFWLKADSCQLLAFRHLDLAP
jgi:hypothetical protein